MNSIGKQILKFRKTNGASQTALANFLGVQPQTVSKWEREICLPDIEKLPQIAAFFGISLDELFGTSEANAQENAVIQIDNLISHKKWKEAAKKARACAMEFPHKKCFVQKLLLSLSQALLCKERFPEKFISEAIILGKRNVHETFEPNSKNEIIYHLCKLLYLANHSEEADFYKEMLPSACECRETLDMYRLNSEELILASSQNIALYHMLIGNSFSNMADAAENSGDKKAAAEHAKKAILNYEEAYKYCKNELYIRNSLLSKIYLAEIYLGSDKKALADSVLAEAEISAQNHNLYELYSNYVRRISKTKK